MDRTTFFLVLLVFLAGAANTAHSQSRRETNSWGPFSQESRNFLTITGDASISGGALQITPDSANSNFSLLHRAGRIVYHNPYRLRSGGRLASFDSAFATSSITRSNLATVSTNKMQMQQKATPQRTRGY